MGGAPPIGPPPEDIGPLDVPHSDPPQPWQNFLNRFSLNNLGRLLVVVFLALTAGFGGLDRADPATPVALDQPYDNGPFNITVHAVGIICQHSRIGPQILFGLEYQTNEYQLFGLRATVTNTDKVDAPLDYSHKSDSPAVRELFTLIEPAEFKYMGNYLPESGPNGKYDVPPGKTTELLAIWGVPFRRPGLKSGLPVRIHINDIELFTNSAGDQIWRYPRPRAPYGDLRTTLGDCI